MAIVKNSEVLPLQSLVGKTSAEIEGNYRDENQVRGDADLRRRRGKFAGERLLSEDLAHKDGELKKWQEK